MKGRQCQQGPGQKEVEVETKEINHELGSSPPLPPPLEQDPHPSGGPLVSHLVPPPDLLLEEKEIGMVKDRSMDRT